MQQAIGSESETGLALRHFENGVLDAYRMHCKHNQLHVLKVSFIFLRQQKHAYFADGTMLSQALRNMP